MRHALSPKQLFQQTPDSKRLAELVVQEPFKRALSAALAHMQSEMPTGSGQLESPAALHFQMVGARRYIETLLNLAEPIKEPTKLPPKNLTPTPIT